MKLLKSKVYLLSALVLFLAPLPLLAFMDPIPPQFYIFSFVILLFMPYFVLVLGQKKKNILGKTILIITYVLLGLNFIFLFSPLIKIIPSITFFTVILEFMYFIPIIPFFLVILAIPTLLVYSFLYFKKLVKNGKEKEASFVAVFIFPAILSIYIVFLILSWAYTSPSGLNGEFFLITYLFYIFLLVVAFFFLYKLNLWTNVKTVGGKTAYLLVMVMLFLSFIILPLLKINCYNASAAEDGSYGISIPAVCEPIVPNLLIYKDQISSKGRNIYLQYMDEQKTILYLGGPYLLLLLTLYGVSLFDKKKKKLTKK